MKDNFIEVRGAKVHNLKNVNIKIPREKLVVITGVSGSGKSSLAFDTIYAEGQRRYVESLSAYARQFLQVMDKPDVESITGLSPAISIDQKTTLRNPRSTVGTVTEIYDHLRLLFARIGTPHCIECGDVIEKQSLSEIIDTITELPEGKKVLVLAPVPKTNNISYHQIIQQIKSSGFIRIRLDGELITLNQSFDLEDDASHVIEIVVDRLMIKDYSPNKVTLSRGDVIEEVNPEKTRLADSVELALRHGEGFMSIVDYETKDEIKFSEKYICHKHPHVVIGELEPRSFSFNSPHGACGECHGIGTRMVVKEDLIIPNKDLSLEEGALHPWASTTWNMTILETMAKRQKFSLSKTFPELSAKHQNLVLYGTGDTKYDIHYEGKNMNGDFQAKYEGVIPYIERRYNETDSENSRKHLSKYMEMQECPTCEGKKLRREILGVKIIDKNITEVSAMNIEDAHVFFQGLHALLDPTKQKIAKLLLEEIVKRLKFLLKVGLPYLELDRSVQTLSGGEAQRIRLATQIGSALTGVLYVLDEPSIGLHQHDNSRLIETILFLRDNGNSVLVVEHDEEMMLIADHIIEIGPEAGKHGGKVIAQGTPQDIMKDKHSITGAFLSGRDQIAIPRKRSKGNGDFLEIIGANAHNLKNIDVKIPLGCLIGVSGVSGSGKSTLINGILSAELAHHLQRAQTRGLDHKEIKGIEHVDKVIHIDQKAIGRTPRSNPATYTNVFTDIRDLFTNQPEAKIRGYSAARFSFNVKGGRCEACAGDGVKKIEMHFLPDVYVPCEVCKGARYNREALEIKWRGKNIADVLAMTVNESLEFFVNIPNIKNKLQTLADVGVGYIHLGQSATTLSGGEAQRIKLATELSKKGTGKTVYVLDEPTTGLHFQDVKKLLQVLQRLVDKGNTVIVIEHNIDVLKTCDHIIDIGPDGGNKGGELIAEGTPEEIAECERSYTGIYLKEKLMS